MGGSNPADIRRFFSTQTETEARPITLIGLFLQRASQEGRKAFWN
jgi:hypothetical protein